MFLSSDTVKTCRFSFSHNFDGPGYLLSLVTDDSFSMLGIYGMV